MRRIISKYRRWLDRRREGTPVYITPQQYNLYISNQRYRWARRHL